MSLPKPTQDTSFDLEQQFILRMPEEAAKYIEEDINSNVSFKDSFSIEMKQDMRNCVVRYNGQVYRGKLMDLPCIIESLKTTDRKNFYKTADISQMMICSQTGNVDDGTPIQGSAAFLAAKSTHNRTVQQTSNFFGRDNREFQYLHGITPPLKNVLRRRFRKTRKKRSVDMPQIEKEVKNLLRSDLQADSVVWEVVWSDPPKPAGATASAGAAGPSDASGGNSAAALRKTSPTGSKLSATSIQATGLDLSDDDHENLVRPRVLAMDHLFGVISSSSEEESDRSDSEGNAASNSDDGDVDEAEEPTPTKSGRPKPASSSSSSSYLRHPLGRNGLPSPLSTVVESEYTVDRVKTDLAAQLHLSDSGDDYDDNDPDDVDALYEHPVDAAAASEITVFNDLGIDHAPRVEIVDDDDDDVRALVGLEEDVEVDDEDDGFVPAGGELLADVDPTIVSSFAFHHHQRSPREELDDDEEQRF